MRVGVLRWDLGRYESLANRGDRGIFSSQCSTNAGFQRRSGGACRAHRVSSLLQQETMLLQAILLTEEPAIDLRGSKVNDLTLKMFTYALLINRINHSNTMAPITAMINRPSKP